jgi:hypothetical protein
MVSANEARRALKEIIEDRKTLSQEISALKARLQAKMDEPSSKVKYLLLFFSFNKCLGCYGKYAIVREIWYLEEHFSD